MLIDEFSYTYVMFFYCYCIVFIMYFYRSAVNKVAQYSREFFGCFIAVSFPLSSLVIGDVGVHCTYRERERERERERQAGGRVRDKARFACWAATALLCVVSWPSVRSGPVRCGWVARSAADGVRSTATLISLRPRRDPNNVTKMHASSSLTS